MHRKLEGITVKTVVAVSSFAKGMYSTDRVTEAADNLKALVTRVLAFHSSNCKFVNEIIAKTGPLAGIARGLNLLELQKDQVQVHVWYWQPKTQIL